MWANYNSACIKTNIALFHHCRWKFYAVREAAKYCFSFIFSVKRVPQKGLKLAFLEQKKPVFLAKIFLSGIGGYPPPPLNRKSSCPKTLSGKGGYPHPPLNGQNPLKRF